MYPRIANINHQPLESNIKSASIGIIKNRRDTKNAEEETRRGILNHSDTNGFDITQFTTEAH